MAAVRREPLSRERVLRTALDLIDRDGLDGFSMRTLGRALGFEAMSLYRYVHSRDELLAALGDMVMSEIDLPRARPSEWKGAMRRMAVSYHAALRRHPWVHGLQPTPERVGSATAAYMEWTLGTLRQGGFSARMTHHAFHIIESHIVGSSQWEAGVRAALKDRPISDLAQTFLERIPIAQFPYIHEHLEQHMGGATKGDKHPFEIGLDLILDGLERSRGAESTPRHPRTRGP